MLCVSKCIKNELTTANLSYKKIYISKKDNISVIQKIIFHLTKFSVHSKLIFMYTGAHREDHCSRPTSLIKCKLIVLAVFFFFEI